jgi:hypothetical protein
MTSTYASNGHAMASRELRTAIEGPVGGEDALDIQNYPLVMNTLMALMGIPQIDRGTSADLLFRIVRFSNVATPAFFPQGSNADVTQLAIDLGGAAPTPDQVRWQLGLAVSAICLGLADTGDSYGYAANVKKVRISLHFRSWRVH